MAKTKKTPDEIAREQVAAEEEARRESRIAEIVAAEEVKQEAERKEKEAVEERRKAASEAGKLVEERKPLEDALQTKIEELAPMIEELADLHDRHRKALGESLDPEYNKRHHEGYEKISVNFSPDWTRSGHDVRDTVRSYLEGSLSGLYRDAKTLSGTSGASLAEADPLTPVDAEDQAGRPVGDFPWDRLEQTRQEIVEKDADERERKRLHDGYKKLEAIAARRKQMRGDYGREVSWREVAVAEERTRLSEVLSEEEIADMWAKLTGEEDRDRDSPRPAVSSDMVSESGRGA